MKNHNLWQKLVLGVSLSILICCLGAAGIHIPSLVYAEDKPENRQAVDWAQIIEDHKESSTVESRLLRGIAYANLGSLAQAFEELSIAGEAAYHEDVASFVLDKLSELRHSPDDVLLLNCAAFGSYAFGDLEQSTNYFEKIIRLEPDNVWTRNFCAFTYGERGDIDRAIHHLEHSLKLDRGNQYTHLLLSAAYKEKQQYLMAIYHYLQAPEAVRELKQHGAF